MRELSALTGGASRKSVILYTADFERSRPTRRGAENVFWVHVAVRIHAQVRELLASCCGVEWEKEAFQALPQCRPKVIVFDCWPFSPPRSLQFTLGKLETEEGREFAFLHPSSGSNATGCNGAFVARWCFNGSLLACLRCSGRCFTKPLHRRAEHDGIVR